MQVLKFISATEEIFTLDYDILEDFPLLISMQDNTTKIVELEFTNEEVKAIIKALQACLV